MRLSTLLFVVFLVALVLAMARDEIGRVAVIVFFTGVGLVAAGTASLMALFQTVGALGHAHDLASHVEALAATLLVLVVGSMVTLGVMFGGVVLIRWTIP